MFEEVFMNETTNIFIWTLAIIIIYFLPWFIAGARNTKNRAWVAIINVFFGISIFGWFVALAMASGGEKNPK